MDAVEDRSPVASQHDTMRPIEPSIGCVMKGLCVGTDETMPRNQQKASCGGGGRLRQTRPTAFFTLHRALRLRLPSDPSSTPVAPGTFTLWREWAVDHPLIQLAGIERRLYRSGCLRFLGCIHARRDGKSG
jgi:hypothetical protein